ncbi:MAG TPA: CocE/NonD family hydrolase [Thermoanaerobaculia bacterium]|nr:CocE/NonD family hydrolase [Thermoanaerobaculia bacterium]
MSGSRPRPTAVGSLLGIALALLLACAGPPAAAPATAPAADAVHRRDLDVPMRDGVLLRANLWRPAGDGPFPVLVYRTPYGKDEAERLYRTHLRAVERGWAVLLVDVRGRFASQGDLDPYRNEGRDGFDTIEWAAAQPWSDGRVGTYGLSYPGAVQWLAALERPPHLRAMVPAMTFSSPRAFFTFGGVFDLSWLPWIHLSMAPATRVRHDLPGARTAEEAAAFWAERGSELLEYRPLVEVPATRDVAPFYFEWLAHPPEDPWWDPLEIRGRYAEVDPAVLHLSGWHDEAYGPEGAATNFAGLVAARGGVESARTELVLGPWVHGVGAVSRPVVGERDFGPDAALDYDALVLDFLDRHVRGADLQAPPPVRYFLMGEDRWREAQTWPPPAARESLFLVGGEERGSLRHSGDGTAPDATAFVSDPEDPVRDPYAAFGAHDYRALATGPHRAVFETAPFAEDTEISGPITAEVWIDCDCRDFDLWVRLFDVAPEGTAWNLMSPGLDVQRASARAPGAPRPVTPGEPVRLELDRLVTANLFRRGHRLRAIVTGSFAPHLSRNLQTGASERTSSASRPATLTILHDDAHPSRLVVPVVRGALPDPS